MTNVPLRNPPSIPLRATVVQHFSSFNRLLATDNYFPAVSVCGASFHEAVSCLPPRRPVLETKSLHEGVLDGFCRVPRDGICDMLKDRAVRCAAGVSEIVGVHRSDFRRTVKEPCE